MTERLPNNNETGWGDILGANDGSGGFLRVAHNDDGTLKPSALPMQVLVVDTTPVGTPADSNPHDLMTYTVPGGTLANDGDFLEYWMADVRVAGFFKLPSFGATDLSAGNASQSDSALFMGRIVRLTETTQIASSLIIDSGGGVDYGITTFPSEDLSGDVVIKAVGQGAGTADDVVQRLLIVQRVTAP